MAEHEPDPVCLGGDLISTREREILMFRRPLQLLRPPLGVFAVPGNHDHFWGRDIGLWQAFLQDQGVNVLLNLGHRVRFNGGSLWVCPRKATSHRPHSAPASAAQDARRRICATNAKPPPTRATPDATIRDISPDPPAPTPAQGTPLFWPAYGMQGDLERPENVRSGDAGDRGAGL